MVCYTRIINFIINTNLLGRFIVSNYIDSIKDKYCSDEKDSLINIIIYLGKKG